MDEFWQKVKNIHKKVLNILSRILHILFRLLIVIFRFLGDLRALCYRYSLEHIFSDSEGLGDRARTSKEKRERKML
jgi:hypothetical protein